MEAKGIDGFDNQSFNCSVIRFSGAVRQSRYQNRHPNSLTSSSMPIWWLSHGMWHQLGKPFGERQTCAVSTARVPHAEHRPMPRSLESCTQTKLIIIWITPALRCKFKLAASQPTRYPTAESHICISIDIPVDLLCLAANYVYIYNRSQVLWMDAHITHVLIPLAVLAYLEEGSTVERAHEPIYHRQLASV